MHKIGRVCLQWREVKYRAQKHGVTQKSVKDAVMQPEVRDAYRRLLAQGWIDATRALHPKERIYTYWIDAAAFQRNAGESTNGAARHGG